MISSYKLSRLLIIDALIRSETYPSLEDLRKGCMNLPSALRKSGPASSIIEKDISFMRNNFDAPIGYNSSYRGYYYENDFMFLMPFNPDSLEAIKISLKNFSHLANASIVKSIRNSIRDFEKQNKIYTKSNRLGHTKYVDFEVPTSIKGIKYFDVIFQATTKRRVLKFEYKSYWKPKEKVTLKPFLLKEHERWWYCIGKNEKNEIKTYALDRIQSTPKIQKDIFKPDPSFKPENLFKYSFGITVDNKIPDEEIVLSFMWRTGQYVLSKPLHESQTKIKSNKEEVVISLRTNESPELWRKILSYGHEVKIISPDTLKEEMMKHYVRALAQYF